MQKPLLATFAALLALAVPVATHAQSVYRGDCPRNESGYPERCMGRIMVTAGQQQLPVFVDGLAVGSTPVHVILDPSRHPVVEIRPENQPVIRRTLTLRRGRIVAIDLEPNATATRARLERRARIRRGPPERIDRARPQPIVAPPRPPLTNTSLYSFDECDGYRYGGFSTTTVAGNFADVLRNYSHPDDADRYLPTPSEVFSWDQTQCTAGQASSCITAARTLRDGATGIASDERAAMALFTRACDALNSAEACAWLARLYDYRPSPLANQALALQYQQRACSLGDSESCCSFATRLENGQDIAKDLSRALTLYRQWCTPATPICCQGRDRLNASSAARASVNPRTSVSP